jgi:2-oxoisovalerate dehydrogenase E1 component beta subunit
MALAYEMAHDPSVVVLGEDVGVNGGVFRATVGLQQRFGVERVIDTPLDETTIAGLTVGLAAQGMKPIAEAQFEGFIYPMIDHIVCHATRLRHRTRGRLSCPMVLRAPWGGGIRAPEHHSEANEALFAHIPGLRVVIPSSPSRAYGLLLAAIRDPDPVIFFEPKRIYRQYKEEVPDDGEALPLDVCFVLRDGDDVHPGHLGRTRQGTSGEPPKRWRPTASAPKSSTSPRSSRWISTPSTNRCARPAAA